jgi:hypothetical protein
MKGCVGSLLRLGSFAAAVLAATAFFSANCAAQGFPPISQDDLKMTGEPQAPGAPAIILFREVDRDDNSHTSHEDNYVRTKILTEEGRKYANIEIIFNKSNEDVGNIHGRTIRPDGSSVEFDGKVLERVIEKAQGLKYVAKTFDLPDVQPGSIIEYRYTIDLREHLLFGSHWILSEGLFTRYARFSLKPYTASSFATPYPIRLRWTYNGVPPGSEPKQGPDRVVRMEVHDMPAFHVEDFMPPPNELKARVDFIYDNEYLDTEPDQYWKHVDKKRNGVLESFIDKRKAMDEAVVQIVAAGDPPEVKLRKIYDRVQQIRNTTYEIRKTAQETKRENEKPNENVEDVWKRGYGSHHQITMLFIALARAAGFEAYGVLASSRRDYFFNPKTMESAKLNTLVALVKLNDKDLYFDPGAEFAPYGMLIWSETGTTGLRLDRDGGTWVKTSLPQSSESRMLRKAELKLTETGDLTGKVTLTCSGLAAMYYRLDVRNADDIARKKFLEDRIRSQIPVATEVELTNQPDWTSTGTPLVGEFKITTAGWASNAGKRAVIPAGLFTAPEKRLFEHAQREHPIYVHYLNEKIDDVTIELPAGWKVDSVPPAQSKGEPRSLTYALSVDNNQTSVHLTRKIMWNFLLVEAKYYPALRNFFQDVRTGDEQQIVLQPAATSAAQPAAQPAAN